MTQDELISLSHRQYCQTTHWRNVREFVLARDGQRCVLCNRKARAAHHRSYTHKGADLIIEARDCVAVCMRCHQMFHASWRIARAESWSMSCFESDPIRGGFRLKKDS